jgi:BASS family bile acid:Na+ symporter
MQWLKLPAAGLAWIGRHGTLLVAASIFVGLAVPPLAAAFKPILGETIILLLTLSFLRVDPAELRRHWARPGLIAAASAWTMLVVPAALGVLFLRLGIGERMPGLYFILVLQSSAPVLMSLPALAALIGLDVALTLSCLIATTVIAPVSASFYTHLFLGAALVSPIELGIKLALMIAGTALAATLIRYFAGRAWIEAQRERIDGLSVLAMFMFAAAVTDGVTAHFLADPLLVIGLAALAFAVALALIAITAAVFWRAGRARALAIGLIAGNRNVGLMLAATGFMVPDVSWLYFALAQFPIYLLPHLLKPLSRRLQQNATA